MKGIHNNEEEHGDVGNACHGDVHGAAWLAAFGLGCLQVPVGPTFQWGAADMTAT